MLLELAKALANYGHICYIYSYASRNSQMPIPNSIVYISGTEYSENRVLRHLSKIFEIRKIIKKVDPDLIVSFMPYPSISSIVAKAGLKKKIVISERGDPEIYKGFIKLLGHRIMACADGAVFQLESARDFYSKTKLYNKSIVIPNAVTVLKKNRIERVRKNEIAYVGRFDIKQKRQDIMIKAFARILKDFPDVKLVFYGDGPDEHIIRKMVSDFKIDKNVIFAGRVTSVEENIKDKRLFVLSSDYEGIPNALIEAMCAGVPCVATDCTPGGARFLIENEVNGLIVPKGNPEELANACCKILNDPELGERLGTNAQAIIDRLSPDVIYAKWNDFLTNIYKGY